MQHRFIKTAIAMAISAMSCASMAATWGTVSVDGETVAQGIEEALKNRPQEIGNDDQSLAEYRDKMLISLLKLHNKL